MNFQTNRIAAALDQLDTARAGTSAIKIGLLGRGIGASLTPRMHEAEGRRLGLQYRYDLLDFDVFDLANDQLVAVIEQAIARGYCGFNVTYPFKQQVIPLLDGLDANAAAVGAVNTVRVRDGQCMGYNTDASGFAASLRETMPDADLSHVVQFGAGGAGSAVAHALASLGARRLDIVDLDAEKASALAHRLGGDIKARAIDPQTAAARLSQATGLINTTPIGMAKLPGTPFETSLLEPRHFVIDVIYFPAETELLRQASALGCRTSSGAGMAIHQAADAFSLFSGLTPSLEHMRKTFAQA